MKWIIIKITRILCGNLLIHSSEKLAKLTIPTPFVTTTYSILIQRKCNTFNDYFTNIGPNLAEQINTSNGHFTQYLSTPSEKLLFFHPTNVHEILDIVKSLNSSRSSGFDGISVCILKKIIHNIGDPLSHIFNLSLSTGICPNSLKIAKIIPIFKKDDPSQIGNYRPISLSWKNYL